MRWTKEYTQEMKERVRSVLVRKPNASKYELSRVLGIDKGTALKLKKEVQAENVKNISKQIVEQEVGQLEMEYQQLALECWQIISQDVKVVKETNEQGEEVEKKIPILTRDKLSAIKLLLEARKTLFEIKFDAGIFKKQLGKLGIDADDLITKLQIEIVKNNGTTNEINDSIPESSGRISKQKS